MMKHRRLRTGGDDFECQSPKPNRSMMTDAKKYASWKPTQAQWHVGKLSSTQYWRTTSIWSARRFLFNATSLHVFLDDIFDGSDGCIRPWSCRRFVTSMCGAWIKRGKNTAVLHPINDVFLQSSWLGISAVERRVSPNATTSLEWKWWLISVILWSASAPIHQKQTQASAAE